jgi:hypothetical protein
MAFFCFFIAGILHPQLRRNEQFVAGNAAFPDGLADSFFVAIGSGRINQTIAGLQRSQHAVFTNLGVRNLETRRTPAGAS